MRRTTGPAGTTREPVRRGRGVRESGRAANTLALSPRAATLAHCCSGQAPSPRRARAPWRARSPAAGLRVEQVIGMHGRGGTWAEVAGWLRPCWPEQAVTSAS